MPPRKSKSSQDALKKKVIAAIQRCEEEGRKPTYNAIQELAGGSFRDLSPVIRMVNAERNEMEAAKHATPEMPKNVADLFDAVWCEAFAAADAPAAAARQTFEAELRERDRTIQEIENTLARIETEKEEVDALCVAEGQRADAAEGQVQDLRVRVRDLEVSLQNALDRLNDRSTLLADMLAAAQGHPENE